MKKILFVFGSGGHAEEALRLFRSINKNFSFEFMLEKGDPLSEEKLKGFRIFKVVPTRGKKESYLVTFFRTILCSIESVCVYFKSRPDIILSTGPGLAVPISFIGKIFGKKVVFVESWSRANTKSISGKLIYSIADDFYVQWPEMKKKYPKSIYKGRLG